jgi:hypothetical protein
LGGEKLDMVWSEVGLEVEHFLFVPIHCVS